jgi:hypothetical protein
MNYTGHVKKGVVVFDGPTRPAEGATVRVEEMTPSTVDISIAPKPAPTWAEVFKGLIGAAEGLPADMAENHDHYIHGAPKR